MKMQLTINKLSLLFMVSGLILLPTFSVFAQNGTPSIITSDYFNDQRALGGSSKSNEKAKKSSLKPKISRANYKYVQQSNKVVRSSSTVPSQKKSTSQPEKVIEVGVTIWRLRPPVPADSGPKLPVQINDSGLKQMWTPERVPIDTIFNNGDRMRLAIESSVSGYLYVINSEVYSDGSFGIPSLIFPSSLDEDNSVYPGMLADIPDQREELPYFLITPKGKNYDGELLTIIISPKSLSNLEIDENNYIKNLETLGKLESSSNFSVFSRTDIQDKIYTKEESQSTCGTKTRQIVREKPAQKPCGTQTRQLDREAPLPQSIYRIKTQVGQPAVSFIKLAVKN